MRNLTKHVLIAKDLNYAASLTNAAADSAANPQDLAVGAIGVYNENGTLIPAAGTGAADAKALDFYVKHADGLVKATLFPKIVNANLANYAAPVNQVSFLGYNGTSGSLNTTIAAGTEFVFRITETSQGYEPLPRDNYSYVAKTGDTEYDILLNFNNSIINDSAQKEVTVTPAIISNGTRTQFASGAGADVTNGSTTVTVTGHGLSAGDFVKFEGVLYKIVSVDTNTFVIDRPYEGATATIAQADADTGSYASITEYGLRITGTEAGQIFALGRDEGLEQATLTEPKDGTPAVAFNPGVGTYAQVAALEARGAAYRGHTNRVWYTRTDLGKRTVNPNLEAGGTYDILKVDFYNVYDSKAFSGQAADPTSLYVCLENGGTAGDNNAEAAMVAIVNAVSDLADIS